MQEKSKPSKAIEIIKDKLYWVSDKQPPTSQHQAFFFCIDKDFGPLNLSKTHKFCIELDKLLRDKKFKDNKIYHYCGTSSAKQANAAYLMGAYLVIMQGRTAKEAYSYFEKHSFKPFRDATTGPCTYPMTIKDCLKALQFAVKAGWYNYKKFNTKEYDYYEAVEHGDINHIIPKKFVAFSGPSATKVDPDGYRLYTPEDYCPIFKKMNVGTIVRLNKSFYDKTIFEDEGFNHHDMYFIDGTPPPPDILDKFLAVSQQEPKAVAVHCKAGLGRTGTLIAMYAMKHFRIPAPYIIAWIRICRPGSILGPQQHYLLENQDKMFKLYDKMHSESPSKVCLAQDEDDENDLKRNIEMSPEECFTAKHGDRRQGYFLVERRKNLDPGATQTPFYYGKELLSTKAAPFTSHHQNIIPPQPDTGMAITPQVPQKVLPGAKLH